MRLYVTPFFIFATCASQFSGFNANAATVVISNDQSSWEATTDFASDGILQTIDSVSSAFFANSPGVTVSNILSPLDGVHLSLEGSAGASFLTSPAGSVSLFGVRAFGFESFSLSQSDWSLEVTDFDGSVVYASDTLSDGFTGITSSDAFFSVRFINESQTSVSPLLLDNFQYALIAPEPSSSLLVSIAGLMLITRRKRL